MDTSALPHGAENPRPRVCVGRIGWHAVAVIEGDSVARDFELSTCRRHVQHQRLRPIQAQDVQPLEWNRLTERHRQPCHDLFEVRSLGDKPGNAGEHGRGIGHHD
jgi:hypothetical protein